MKKRSSACLVYGLKRLVHSLFCSFRKIAALNSSLLNCACTFLTLSSKSALVRSAKKILVCTFFTISPSALISSYKLCNSWNLICASRMSVYSLESDARKFCSFIDRFIFFLISFKSSVDISMSVTAFLILQILAIQ